MLGAEASEENVSEGMFLFLKGAEDEETPPAVL